jgi:hypothetical protein
VTITGIVLAVTPKVPKDGEGVKSGPIGLAVILVLCVAVYFLFKSMSKHLKKVRDDFPTDKPSASKKTPAPPEDSVQLTDSTQSATELSTADAAPAESPPKPDPA